MKKKLMALVLSVLLVFGILPISAFTAFAASTQITTALDLTAKETTDNLATEGWQWDAAAKTLTLDGLDLSVATSPAISVPADTTIILADGSANTITTTAKGGIGILTAGNLTVKTADGFTTKGNLTIKAEASSTQGISLVGAPDETKNSFSFSNIDLDITARRGVQMTTDNGDREYDYSASLNNVDYTFANNEGVTNYRSIQIWVDNGSAALALENSKITATGDIYVVGGTNEGSASYVNIEKSNMNITGALINYYGDKAITNVNDSTINAKQIKVTHWYEWGIYHNAPFELAELNVTDSTLNVGPTGENNAAIEVGSNSAIKAVANFKNSTIVSVNDKKAAISASQWSENANKAEQEAWTQAARGTVNIENCTMLLAGSKDYGDLETGKNEGNNITNVVYPTVPEITTNDDGTKEIDFPKDTVITSGDKTYTVKESAEDAKLTVNTNTGVLGIPAGTEIEDESGEKVEADDSLVLAPGSVVAAERSFVLEADKTEYVVDETVTVTVSLEGDNLVTAKWTLVYDSEKFELLTGNVEGLVFATGESGVFANGEAIATYTFKVLAQDVDNVAASFTVENATAATYDEAILDSDITANVIPADVTIVFAELDVTVKFDNEEPEADNAELTFDGAEHIFAITSNTEGAIITINGEIISEFKMTDVNGYVIEYSVTKAGYTPVTGTFTVTISDPDYTVSVDDTKDYVDGKKLVLVGTNSTAVSFTYAGKTMYEVTGKYTVDGYAKVYAYIVDAEDYDAANAAIVYSPVSADYVIAYDNNNINYDLNGLGGFNHLDIATAYGVYNGHANYFENYMAVVLKADFNGDGIVDGTDTTDMVLAYNNANN